MSGAAVRRELGCSFLSEPLNSTVDVWRLHRHDFRRRLSLPFRCDRVGLTPARGAATFLTLRPGLRDVLDATRQVRGNWIAPGCCPRYRGLRAPCSPMSLSQRPFGNVGDVRAHLPNAAEYSTYVLRHVCLSV